MIRFRASSPEPWLLSMLGIFVIGIKILFNSRWQGLAPVSPTVAES